MNRKFTAFWWGMFQKRSQRTAESNICVDLRVCVISLWSPSAGPLPDVAAHTVKSYECCNSPRGYRHFNNSWIVQSKSIAIDLSGSAKWSRGRKEWCNSTLRTTLWGETKKVLICSFLTENSIITVLNPCTPSTLLHSSFQTGWNIKGSPGSDYKKKNAIKYTVAHIM